MTIVTTLYTSSLELVHFMTVKLLPLDQHAPFLPCEVLIFLWLAHFMA